MSRKISVVIPYYQQEPGILRAAVLSAMGQVGVAELDIIVVDDGSPSPARDDLESLDVPAHVTLKLIEQSNRGPGAARNRALDAVSPDTAYVAFLDSDDKWTPKHLSNAHFLLDAGYDFYFANAACLNKKETQFSDTLNSAQHLCINQEKKFYKFMGNAAIDLLDWRIFCHPSTVVYSFHKFPKPRFSEFSRLGEDWSFWLELISGSSDVGFCSNVECILGRGVNIGSSAGWDSPKCIWGFYEYMKVRKWLENTYMLDEKERKCNMRQMELLRKSFAGALIHELRMLRAFSNADIVRFIMLDPLVLFHIFPVLLKKVKRKSVSLFYW